MRKTSEIIELIRQKKILKSDAQVAKILKMTPTALNNHKQRDTKPFDQIVTFCIEEKLSFDWLVLGDDEIQDQIENLKAGLRYFEKRVLELTERLRQCDSEFEEEEPEPAEYFPKDH